MAQTVKPRHLIDMSDEQKSKVKEYVLTNYKGINDADGLIITATVSGVFVRTNKDSSPLILNSSIIN